MWEKIDTFTYRMEVPEGWIVKTIGSNISSDPLVFVPDKEHAWKLPPN